MTLFSNPGVTSASLLLLSLYWLATHSASLHFYAFSNPGFYSASLLLLHVYWLGITSASLLLWLFFQPWHRFCITSIITLILTWRHFCVTCIIMHFPTLASLLHNFYYYNFTDLASLVRHWYYYAFSNHGVTSASLLLLCLCFYYAFTVTHHFSVYLIISLFSTLASLLHHFYYYAFTDLASLLHHFIFTLFFILGFNSASLLLLCFYWLGITFASLVLLCIFQPWHHFCITSIITLILTGRHLWVIGMHIPTTVSLLHDFYYYAFLTQRHFQAKPRRASKSPYSDEEVTTAIATLKGEVGSPSPNVKPRSRFEASLTRPV